MDKERYHHDLFRHKVENKLLKNEIEYLKTQSSPSPAKSKKYYNNWDKENYSSKKVLFLQDSLEKSMKSPDENYQPLKNSNTPNIG